MYFCEATMACTSVKQQWHEKNFKRGRVHQPSQMSKINFDRPHPERDANYSKRKRWDFDPRPVYHRESNLDWNKLLLASDGNASVLCFKNKTNKSDPNYDESPVYTPSSCNPPTFADIVKDMNSEDFHVFLALNRTEGDINKIEELTKGQSDNKLWFSFRSGVITASVANSVLSITKRLKPNPKTIENVVAKILNYSKPIRIASLSYGTEYEKYARKRYVIQNKKIHLKFEYQESGLRIHPFNHILGASVDGYITCVCCGNGNLEIKCPFTHRDKSIAEYSKFSGSCIRYCKEKYILKQNHAYHTEIQHQMYITGRNYTDFVVYLQRESCTIRIQKDPNYEIVQVSKLLNFFNRYILPEMFDLKISDKFAAKSLLDDMVNIIVN